MQKYFFLFVSFLCIVSTLNGQNLIADPGFEIWDGTLPNTNETLSPLTHWYNVEGTPDHHHVDNMGSNLNNLTDDCDPLAGNSDCGTAYEGDAVIGIYKANGRFGKREWAGTKLTSSMIDGNCYEVSYWVNSKK